MPRRSSPDCKRGPQSKKSVAAAPSPEAQPTLLNAAAEVHAAVVRAQHAPDIVTAGVGTSQPSAAGVGTVDAGEVGPGQLDQLAQHPAQDAVPLQVGRHEIVAIPRGVLTARVSKRVRVCLQAPPPDRLPLARFATEA